MATPDFWTITGRVDILSDWASSATSGLCPPLCSEVSSYLHTNDDYLPSEYAVRDAIDEVSAALWVSGTNLCGHNISNKTLGFFKQFNDTNKFLEYRTIEAHPACSARIAISYNPGYSGDTPMTGHTLNIYYNGNPVTDVYVKQNQPYVQGGVYQMMAHVSADDCFQDLSPTITVIDDDYLLYQTTQESRCNTKYMLPILARSACKKWKNYDQVIAKIAIRIPIEDAFYERNQRIYIGYAPTDVDGNIIEISAEPYRFGYFDTQTSGQIISGGEWIPLTYSGDLSAKQYDYIEHSGVMYPTAQNGLKIIRGPGNPDDSSDPYDDPIGRFYGSFDYRVWYDRIGFEPLETKNDLLFGYGVGNYYAVARLSWITGTNKDSYPAHPDAVRREPIVDKLVYANDTWDFSIASVPAYRDNGDYDNQSGGAALETNTYGFFVAPNRVNSSGGYTNTLKQGFRLTWANTTWSNSSATISLKGGTYCSHQNDYRFKAATKGYIFGGITTSSSSGGQTEASTNKTLFEYEFSTETDSLIETTHSFNIGRRRMNGMSKENAMYFLDFTPARKEIIKIDTANLAITYTDDALLAGHRGNETIAFTDGNMYGWSPGKDAVSYVELNMSTETTSEVFADGYANRKQRWMFRSAGTYSWTNGYVISKANKSNSQKFDYSTKIASEFYTLSKYGLRRGNQLGSQSG